MPQPLLPLICVGGPSAAGKSQLSAQLAAALRSQGINPLPIACDDYYRCGWSGDGPYGFDTPAAIDSELLIQQLHTVRRVGGLCSGFGGEGQREPRVDHVFRGHRFRR